MTSWFVYVGNRIAKSNSRKICMTKCSYVLSNIQDIWKLCHFSSWIYKVFRAIFREFALSPPNDHDPLRWTIQFRWMFWWWRHSAIGQFSLLAARFFDGIKLTISIWSVIQSRAVLISVYCDFSFSANPNTEQKHNSMFWLPSIKTPIVTQIYKLTNHDEFVKTSV